MSISTNTAWRERRRSTAWPAGASRPWPQQSKISQYDRSLLWVRKDHYVYWRIENYRRGSLLRRASFSDLENMQGIWTARTIEMTDLRQNSRTMLRLEKLEYQVPMKDEAFTLQALRVE